MCLACGKNSAEFQKFSCETSIPVCLLKRMDSGDTNAVNMFSEDDLLKLWKLFVDFPLAGNVFNT